MIEDIFRNTIKELGLVKKKDRIVLGISGGPDSMCMLYLFSQLKKEYNLSIVCAHFNHALREDADKEELFVKKVCQDLKIKFISEKKEVRKFFKGDSLEQTARNLRYDFFLKCCRQTKMKKLALAHHKDDLVETVLMRMIRGSGLRGLRGFLSKSKYRGITVIRPLIEMNKKEIIDWLKYNKIYYCIDESNFEDKFFRNRIRLKLLPFLQELNPNIVDNLCNLAHNLSVDYDFIYNIAKEKFQYLKRRETKRDIRLDLKGLKELPPAIFNNVFRVAVEELKGNVRKIEGRHIKEIKDLVLNRPCGSIVDLPDLLVKKEENLLIIQTLIL
jgi:tRNA(Ile)-lysidine synthase